ncbi:MAG: DUF421 domain-containing protein [Ruminococcaceae bacterium]|nr:DUF421 domain-containing protein [Oscillospiraceae bacterium]
MVTILVRTVIVYLVMIIAVRLMGKRQIGELEVTDLVATLLISEIASLPITDSNIPISHAIIPIIILMSFEICSAALTVLFPKIKGLFTARPSTLIKNGVMCKRSMLDSRISNDELISELRQNGYTDINDVLYAILEKNGKMTIIPKAKKNVPTCEQMQIKVKENGVFHIVIDNGTVNEHGLCEVGLTRAQLEHKLGGASVKDIYLMMISDSGEERTVKKEELL